MQEVNLNNLTIVATNQLFPAGQYKNIYVLSNDDGIVFKINLFILNFSKDKSEM